MDKVRKGAKIASVFGKKVTEKAKKINKKIDDKLTPKKVKEAEARLAKTQRKRNKDAKPFEAGVAGPQLKAERLAKNKKQKEKLDKIKQGSVSKRKKAIGVGAAVAVPAVIGTGIALSGGGKDKAKEEAKATTGAVKKTATVKKKTTTTAAKKDDGKKTFRERRLARMKKRLEGSENEGRKRRLTRRIGRVEGRIEDSKKKPVKKMGGGMMKSKMASKGGKMGGKMVRGYKDGDEVRKSGSVGVGKNSKKDEPRTGGQGGKVVPRDKKGLAKLPKKIRNKMGYKAEGGMMAKKGYSKGGAVKRGKPRGVGAATRGYGKALK